MPQRKKQRWKKVKATEEGSFTQDGDGDVVYTEQKRKHQKYQCTEYLIQHEILTRKHLFFLFLFLDYHNEGKQGARPLLDLAAVQLECSQWDILAAHPSPLSQQTSGHITSGRGLVKTEGRYGHDH